MIQKPFHAAVLQYISLCCLRFENNIEGEGLQVAFGLVHLLTKMTMLMIAIVMNIWQR